MYKSIPIHADHRGLSRLNCTKDNCPQCELITCRVLVGVSYKSWWDVLNDRMTTKYWWNGTDPADIDDALGEVLDGQFFGPMWMQKPVYKMFNFFEKRATAQRSKWGDRLWTKGTIPPRRHLTKGGNENAVVAMAKHLFPDR